MEKRGSLSDQLAITKSAAWAWLEHRSSPEAPEFYVTRNKFNAKPTRYKAEAEKKVKENPNSTCKTRTSTKESIYSNGYYSLFDRYEIERISTQLDYYIESSRSHRHSNGGGHSGRRAEAAAAVETKNKHGGKKVTKGLWLGSHAPLACGSSRGDVVDRMSVEYSRRRRSSERRRAAAGEVVGCRPRPGIRT